MTQDPRQTLALFLLEEEQRKILQPEYAIGSGVISRDDYNKLKDEFFAQSELSLGLIVPIVLIVLGVKLTPQLNLAGIYWVFMCVALVPIVAVLFWVGMERRNKFRLELSLLILGNWQKLQDKKEADKKAAAEKEKTKKAAEEVAKKVVEEVVKKVAEKPDSKLEEEIKKIVRKEMKNPG
jgi:hypothetical protein